MFLLLVLAAFPGCSEPKGVLPYKLEITEERVGPITPETPCDAARIAPLLPGFEIGSYTAMDGGKGSLLLRATSRGKTIMEILPGPEGKVGSVIVTLGDHLPDFAAKGSSVAALFEDEQFCTLEMPGYEKQLLCALPGSKRLYYLFTPSVAERLPLTPQLRDTLRAEALVWISHG